MVAHLPELADLDGTDPNRPRPRGHWMAMNASKRSRMDDLAELVLSGGRWAPRFPADPARTVWPLAVLLASAAVTALVRPFVPGPQTATLAAAWEMVRHGAWLLPQVNGKPAELPPLVPWLTALGWSIVGTNEVWPRAIAPFATLAAFALLRPIARALWPEHREAPALALWTFVGAAGVMLSAPVFGTEPVAMALAAAGSLGLIVAASGASAGWFLYGAAFGFMILAIGAPAIAVLLPQAVLAPVWVGTRDGRWWAGWYASLAAAIAVTLALVLAWVLPASALPRAPAPASLLLNWSEAGPTFSLIPVLLLPFFFYPWPFWPRSWRALWRDRGLVRDGGVRLCLISILVPVAVLALAGDNGWRRLLLVAPPAALLVARIGAGNRPGRADYHAVLPGLLLIVIGLIPITVQIVPWAQLESRARELAGIERLPFWLGAISVAGALALLGGTFLLVQATPRLMVSRATQVALLSVLLAASVDVEIVASLGRIFDLKPVAREIARLARDGTTVATLGLKSSTYEFAGRLDRPLAVFDRADEALAWARDHHDGVIAAPFQGSVLHLPEQPLYVAPQGPGWVALWPAATVLESEGRVLAPRF